MEMAYLIRHRASAKLIVAASMLVPVFAPRYEVEVYGRGRYGDLSTQFRN